MITEAIPIFIILMIVTFLFLRWITKRYYTNKKERNITFIIASVFLSPVIYILSIGINLCILFYEPEYDFNKEKWFSDASLRFRMKDDIVANKILEGKSKNQVIELIGRPDNYDSLNIWNYDLGSSSAGLGWQYNYLQLIFEMEKVKEVKNGSVMD